MESIEDFKSRFNKFSPYIQYVTTKQIVLYTCTKRHPTRTDSTLSMKTCQPSFNYLMLHQLNDSTTVMHLSQNSISLLIADDDEVWHWNFVRLGVELVFIYPEPSGVSTESCDGVTSVRNLTSYFRLKWNWISEKN